MQGILLTNIRQLVNVREDTGPLYGAEMAELPVIDGRTPEDIIGYDDAGLPS